MEHPSPTLPTDVMASAQAGPLERFKNDLVGSIEIWRDSVSKQTPKELKDKVGTGYAGTVGNAEGFVDVVRDNYGGGRYRIRGVDSEGKAVSGHIEIPGPSLPLPGVELEDEDEEGFPLPGTFPGMGMPGMPGGMGMPGLHPFQQQMLQQQMMAQQMGMGMWPQARPPWQEGNSKEADRLRSERDVFRAERDEARSETRRQRDTTERDRRELEGKIGDLREQLRGAQEDTKLQALKAEFSVTVAELKGEAAAKPQGQDPAIKQLGSVVTTLLNRKETDPLEVAKLVKSFSNSGGGGDSIKSFRELLMLTSDIKDLTSDRDDSPAGTLLSVMREAGRYFPEGGDEQQSEQQPQQQQQQPVNGTGQPQQQTAQQRAHEEVMWKEMLQEVRTYYASGNTPEASALALAGWARAKAMDHHLPRLGSWKTAGELLKMFLNLASMSEPTFAQALREFVGTFRDEDADKWLNGLLAALRGETPA